MTDEQHNADLDVDLHARALRRALGGAGGRADPDAARAALRSLRDALERLEALIESGEGWPAAA